MNGCIYLISCLENNKKYVGQHCKPDPKERWNVHKRSKENYPFHNAIRKYGPTGFSWEVLLICPHEKLTEMEGYYAEVFGTYIWDNPGGYNAVWCSDSPNLGIKMSDEQKQKIGQANLGKKHSPEHIEKSRQATLGKKRSPEVIEKMRQAKLGNKYYLGKKRSPEIIEIIRQAKLGKKMSSETKEKLCQANLGKKCSPETLEKMRIAQQKRRNQHLVQLPPLTLAAPNKAI